MIQRKSLPKVSIVITAYNAAQFIGASVAAALSQEYPSYEVIVVDDGSSDATGEICGKISDSRLRYIRAGRIGRSRALNEGISKATGKYIAINDADDLSFPCRLKCAVDLLEAHEEIALLGTAYAATAEFQERVPEVMVAEGYRMNIQPSWITRTALYRSNPFVHSTIVFPKSTWEKVGGYDVQLDMCVDYDFFLRAMRFGRAAWLPARTLLYFKNRTSFFKKRKPREYRETLILIKQRARRILNLPFWVRGYDLLPIYQSLRAGVFRFRTRYECQKK